MKQRLAILLWAVSPDAPHLCAAPFFHAAAAAAMNVEVEAHFSARSVLLLAKGVAASLFASADRERSIYEYMRQATQLGARLYACSDALDAHLPHHPPMLDELAGVAGATAFLGRVLDPDWATMVF